MPVVLEHICKSFADVTALSAVDLEVKDGELFGLIGPDGAGKSTLFRVMASLLLPDSGRCTVNGHDVVTDYREIRRIIGYMPGRFSLYLDLSVEENLSFYAGVFGTTVREHYDLIREVYRHIEPFRKRLAGRLSGGMKQKLALSCALIHRPEVLILDEPTTGVDAVSRNEFWELLKKIRAEGITIVVSTPYMEEAEMCDRVALLQRGRVLDVSAPVTAGAGESALLFALSCRKGIYNYLERLRAMEECRYVWLFGDELHVTLRSEGDRPGMEKRIESWGDPSLEWRPIDPSIEDRFMILMEKEKL